jgi:hypothetical protein
MTTARQDERTKQPPHESVSGNVVREHAEASRRLADEAQQVFDRAEVDLPTALNQLLFNRLGPISTNAADIVSSDGSIRIGPFASVAHSAEIGGTNISIDGVVALIDAYEELTIDTLKVAYSRSRQVKAMTKRRASGATDPTAVAMTIIIIFARRSLLSLDEISEEMSKLNPTTAAHTWPDMVAVEGRGIVNYATRVPGEDTLGSFILPVQDYAPTGFTAPLYIYKSIRSAGRHTFNKVASLLASRVAIFAPGTNLDNYDTGLSELADTCVVTDVYQFDLRGRLNRLGEKDLAQDLMPNDLYGILAGKKKLGTIQYRTWQDGGFLTVRGHFPIEPFLLFLGTQVPSIPRKDLQMIRRPSIQVSMVLPISENDFLRTLSMFQARTSGISIEKDTRKMLIQKYADEGTSSPFYGRLMLGLLRVRDAAISQDQQQPFNKLFDSTFTALVVIRDTGLAIRSNWETHRDKVASRTIVIEEGRHIQITESIDRQLKKETEAFVTGAVRTLKSCMQSLAKHLGTEIGFLFKDEGAFEKGVKNLEAADPLLAAYIAETRKWSQPLILLRNNEIEHGLGAAFRVTYDVEDTITAREPMIQGEAISAFSDRILDRLSCFVEEVTVHLLQKRLPFGIALTETPVGSRAPSAPERFRMTTSVGGLPAWALVPHQKRFEEC